MIKKGLFELYLKLLLLGEYLRPTPPLPAIKQCESKGLLHGLDYL